MTPGDRRYITSYTRPTPIQDRDSVLWRSWIELPAREALEKIFPGLERSNHIPALYTYRTPEELRECSGVTNHVTSEARV